jgi:hypothetical protein
MRTAHREAAPEEILTEIILKRTAPQGELRKL